MIENKEAFLSHTVYMIASAAAAAAAAAAAVLAADRP